MKRKSKKKGQKKSRQKSGAGRALLLLIIIGLGLFLAYHFRREILESLRPFLKKIPEKRLERRAEKEQEKRTPLRERKIVTLYFSEEEGEYLTGEKREISNRESVQEEAKEVIHELINGPREKLIPTLPPRTKLLALQISDAGVAKVNFSLSLAKDHPGGSSAEMMTVYSIVNSLAFNFPQIKRVQILIDGKPIETITGHLLLKRPVSPKFDLVKKQ
jgi:spore germination protein GerM